MKLFYIPELWFHIPIFAIWFWGHFLKIQYLLYKNFQPRSISYLCSCSSRALEWQKVAPFFRGNHNKTSWRFIWTLLEALTLTNSMFPIAKNFTNQILFVLHVFYSPCYLDWLDWLDCLQKRIDTEAINF